MSVSDRPTIPQRDASRAQRVIRRRKNLSYEEKLEIVKLIDSGETKRSVGKKYGLNESTIRGIYQKREQIRAHMRLAPSAGASGAKRSSNRVLLKTEQLMWRYINRQAKRHKTVDTRDLMDTALDMYERVAVKLGVDNPPEFVASKAWINKFKNRQKLKQITDFFRQLQQPDPQTLPHDHQPGPSGMQPNQDTDVSDSDFSGFDPDEVLNQIQDRGVRSGGASTSD